jgi:hypothetical protein
MFLCQTAAALGALARGAGEVIGEPWLSCRREWRCWNLRDYSQHDIQADAARYGWQLEPIRPARPAWTPREILDLRRPAPRLHINSRRKIGSVQSRELQADAGTRTPDPRLTMAVLYQLSYVGANGKS